MTSEVLALTLVAVVHVVGAGVLIWALLDGEPFDWRWLWPRDDDDGPGGPPRGPDAGDPVRPGGLPLPDATPSAVRMREPARLRDALPRPARRPEHAPQRPEREPAQRDQA